MQTKRILALIALTLAVVTMQTRAAGGGQGLVGYAEPEPDMPPLPVGFIPLSSDGQLLMNALNAQLAEDGLAGVLGGGMAPAFAFGPPGGFTTNDLWLEETNIDLTNMTVNLLIHDGFLSPFYQMLHTTNLDTVTNSQGWTLGQILTNSPATNLTVITNVSLTNPPARFFLAHATNNIVGISASGLGGPFAMAPIDAAGDGEFDGTFNFTRNVSLASSLDVHYTISGTASNGVDYSAITNFITIPSFGSSFQLQIRTFFITNANLDFNKTVTLTLLQDRSYLIDTNNGPSATITILEDNHGNEWFQRVTNNPVGLGATYSAVSNGLILSVNFPTGSPRNFSSVNTDGTVAAWSGVNGLTDEVKVDCVPAGSSNPNFTNGDLFYGTGVAGEIGWLSADAKHSNISWLTLSGETVGLRGSLRFDTTGVFGNDLLVVTGNSDTFSGGDIWRVHSRVSATLLASLSCHLEGVTTVPNDPKYGPWAGKLLAGAEDGQGGSAACVFAIGADGVATKFLLNLAPEDIHVVPANQDFYVNSSSLLKLPRSLLTNHVGDVLITQSGEQDAHPLGLVSFVRWNTTNQTFEQTIVPGPVGFEFEHGTFAPMDIPASPIPK